MANVKTGSAKAKKHVDRAAELLRGRSAGKSGPWCRYANQHLTETRAYLSRGLRRAGYTPQSDLPIMKKFKAVEKRHQRVCGRPTKR